MENSFEWKSEKSLRAKKPEVLPRVSPSLKNSINLALDSPESYQVTLLSRNSKTLGTEHAEGRLTVGVHEPENLTQEINK
jgi:hypothetical protein